MTYIEMVTQKKLLRFLKKMYPKEKGYSYLCLKKCDIEKYKEGPFFWVNITNKEDSFIVKLYDYKSTTSNINELKDKQEKGYDDWVRYLYSIFGQAYMEDYLENISKEMFDVF